MSIAMPLTRQVRRHPSRKPWIKRVLSIREPVIYEIQDEPGYVYATWVDGRPVDLLLPHGFRTDGASSPPFSWVFGFRPDGVLAMGGYYHDFYYRHGFFLDPDGNRIFVGRGKGFADRLLAQITAEIAGVDAPGRIARTALSLAGWPAWWGGKKYRDKCAADPDYIELHGDYGD